MYTIHQIIARLFIRHNVGYNRVPIAIDTLIQFILAETGFKNSTKLFKSIIKNTIYLSDKYIIIHREDGDMVIGNNIH